MQQISKVKILRAKENLKMKSSTWRGHQQLESTSQRLPKKNKQVGAKAIWQTLLAYLTTSSEPHVWKTQDATGHTQWNAYDPVTRQSAYLASAEEMRVWLEERHYQHHLAAH